MKSSETSREGFVLAAVIFTIAILGLLAVAALATANDERRSSRAVRESGSALYAAEAGANMILGTAVTTVVDSPKTVLDTLAEGMASGDSIDLGWNTLPSGASYRGVFHRYDSGGKKMFALDVTGRGAGPWGGQRLLKLTLVARTNPAGYAHGAVALGSGITELVSDPTSIIDGTDTPPAGWACEPPGPALPGVASDFAQTQGAGTILGNPPILLDPTITPATFDSFGPYTYADMVAKADKVYPALSSAPFPSPSVTGPNCNTGLLDNWGDPLDPSAPCGDYFPIIHIQGDVEFTGVGSVGQGILLVDGDLRVGGGDFAFYGLIMVKGLCVFEYASSLHGAVQCASAFGEIGDASPILYSSCALEQALSKSALRTVGSVELIGSRAWSEF